MRGRQSLILGTFLGHPVPIINCQNRASLVKSCASKLDATSSELGCKVLQHMHVLAHYDTKV